MLLEDEFVKIPGIDKIEQIQPGMGAEDFAFFLQEAPGCFYYLGTQSGPETAHSGHHPLFDIDEASLRIGAKTLAVGAISFLQHPEVHKK